MNGCALRLSKLTIRDRRGTAVVADVSLEAAFGQALVLIGESGSGKSLIAQAVLGLLPQGFAAEGEIAIGGHPPVSAGDRAALQRSWARDVMLLPQEPRTAFDPTMRIGRQLVHASRGDVAPDAALAAVDLTLADAGLYPFELSGGMAQRALFAAVLTGSAPLVIADEPTKGLDRPRIAQTAALIRELIGRGRALVVVTHDLTLARDLGGTVAVMREGRVVETGASEELFSAPRHPYTRAWLGADPSGWRPCLSCLAMDDPVLTAHGLGFGYRRFEPLFREIDIHVPRGGVLALTGPSGCGKSTLGNILLGLQAPQEGTVLWAGADPYADPNLLRRLRRRYQKLHQDPATAFLPHRTLAQQIADLAEIVPGLDLEQSLPPLLDRLRLKPALLSRFPSEVSGGEAQRVALARILLLQPDVIIADEPTSRLDPLVQQETIALLREIVAERRMGLVLISHDEELVRAIADTVLNLRSSDKSKPLSMNPSGSTPSRLRPKHRRYW